MCSDIFNHNVPTALRPLAMIRVGERKNERLTGPRISGSSTITYPEMHRHQFIMLRNPHTHVIMEAALGKELWR